MSEWFTQFTSSYASSIAYALTAALAAFVLGRLVRPIGRRVDRWYSARFSKNKSTVALPTTTEVRNFSTKQKPTESEWKDAIAFLKSDLSPLLNTHFAKDPPALKLVSHLEKYGRTYQYILWASAIVNLVAAILQWSFIQTLSSAVLWTLLLGMILYLLIAVLLTFIYIARQKTQFKQIKAQIREAMDVIKPGVVFTYGELGSMLKEVDDRGLQSLQAELADIGLSFSLRDMQLACHLVTVPMDQLLYIGEDMVSKLKQLDNLSPEKRREAAQVFVEALRLWPIKMNES